MSYDGSKITYNNITIISNENIKREYSLDYTNNLDLNNIIKCTNCYLNSVNYLNRCNKCLEENNYLFNGYIKELKSSDNFFNPSYYHNEFDYDTKFIADNTIHYHTFNYKNIDSKSHYAICDCGYSEQRAHILSKPTDKYCSLCGGKADIGFIRPTKIIYFKKYEYFLDKEGE